MVLISPTWIWLTYTAKQAVSSTIGNGTTIGNGKGLGRVIRSLVPGFDPLLSVKPVGTSMNSNFHRSAYSRIRVGLRGEAA
ncbi:MAG: hypothetical protein ACO4CG_12475, partial [Prochlorothrix sp.]